jgi:hypothetical protein
MFITEIFNMKNAEGYRTEKDDQSVQKFSDLRKTRLTLAQIKKLRMMTDLKKFEQQKKIEGLSKQYKPPAQTGPAF